MQASSPPLRSTALAPTRERSPLLEQLRHAARTRGDPESTIESLAAWARAFIFFHGLRHPADLGLTQVTHFLEHVVKTAKPPLPALAQARAALRLLYRDVLGTDLGELPQPRPPRVLDQLRHVLRVRHYSPRTEECYVHWARHFILFHQLRHPRTMTGAKSVGSGSRQEAGASKSVGSSSWQGAAKTLTRRST